MQESNLQLSKVEMSFTYLQNKIIFIAFVNSNTVSQNFLNNTTCTIINKYYIHNHHLLNTTKLFETNTVPLLLNTSY